MSVTTYTATAPRVTSTTSIGSLLGAGLVATALASGATSIVAAAGNAAGISLDIAGAPIPVQGFAMLTAIFSVIGLVLAAFCPGWPAARAARSSARRWC